MEKNINGKYVSENLKKKKKKKKKTKSSFNLRRL